MKDAFVLAINLAISALAVGLLVLALGLMLGQRIWDRLHLKHR